MLSKYFEFPILKTEPGILYFLHIRLAIFASVLVSPIPIETGIPVFFFYLINDFSSIRVNV